ncbi:MAG: TetR/AcrR family transcriptional regulator [Chloroflexota bacterium]|nr:TetR/AcrR family transcriptional regulator [Chloroflexota bacterium]
MNERSKGEVTAEKIMRAAQEGFAQNGYAATGVAEICASAGVSKGAFYYHFESKQSLFMALVEAWLGELEGSLAQVAEGVQPVPERLLAMSRLMTGLFSSDVVQISIFFEFWMQAGRDAAVHAAVIAPYYHFQRFFAELLQRGIDEGSLSAIDPVLGAQGIISLASGLLLQRLLDPEGADWGRLLESSMQLLLEGLRKVES